MLPSSSASRAGEPTSLAWRRIGADGSITLEIHAQPGAKRSEVSGVYGDCLRVRVAAPAVEGKANAALIAYLAAAFGVPKRAVTIARGETARRKTVRIAQPRLRPDREW